LRSSEFHITFGAKGSHFSTKKRDEIHTYVSEERNVSREAL